MSDNYGAPRTGSSARWYTDRLKAPKGKKLAILPIPDVLVRALREKRAAQASCLGSAAPALDTDGDWSHPERLNRVTMRCVRASGASPISLPGLRHFNGSWLADSSTSTRVLQQSLRHNSLTTTEDNISHEGQAQWGAVATLGVRLSDAGVSASPASDGARLDSERKCD